ncbi:flavin reductase like domain-containing protein [Aspergillus unguis]
MTVSSFNTVTLTPQPIISFNVRRPSETLQALLSSGRFLVHLLAPNPQTASLARDFSRGNQNLALGEGQFEFVGIKPLVGTAAQDQTQSNSVTGNAAPNQEDALASLPPLPMLRRRGVSQGSSAGVTPEKGSDFDSFPFVFECRLLAESVSQVYDHTIVVGTIVRALTGSEDAEGSSEDLCLTYANTKFWEVGKEVV